MDTLEKTEEDIQYIENDGSRIEKCSSADGPFMCGDCSATLESACGLHAHMTASHSDGSYHYDNVIKTAFPKYDSFCATTQTSSHDRMYLKKYKWSKSGNPPKTVCGVKIESEIRDKYVVMKADEHVPEIRPVKNKEKKEQQSLPSYNLRHTSINQRKCYVSLKPINIDKGEFHSKYQHKDSLPHLSKESSSGHMETLSAAIDATVTSAVVKTEPSVVEDTFNSYDMLDDNDDDESDDNQPLFEDSTASTSSSHDVVTGYSEMDNQPLIEHVHSNDTKPLASQHKKNRKCKRIDTYINEGSTDDNKSDDWTLVFKKQKKRKMQKSHSVNSNIPAASNVTIDADNIDEKYSKKPKLDTNATKALRNLKRREKRREKGKKYRKRFMCDICGEVMQKRNKEAHMNDHFGIKPYICDMCAKSFGTEPRLMNHLKLHDAEKGIGKYMCPQCGKVYGSKDPYQSHLNMHSGARPCKCDKCGGTFKILKDLKEHIGKVHTVKQPIYCSICGKEYFKKTSMQNHMVAAHSDPSLPCRYCTRMFHFEKVRRNHELTHTGEKKYVCCICKHGFIQWTPYLEHMIKQHGYNRETVIDMADKRRKFISEDTMNHANVTNASKDNRPVGQAEVTVATAMLMLNH